MALEYTWTFPSLEVVYNEIDPATGGPVQNAVSVVNWILWAQDETYTTSTYGSVKLPPPGNPFVEFSDLTPEIVQGWVESVVGTDRVNAMKASLAAEIEAQKNPTSGSLAPPWAAPLPN